MNMADISKLYNMRVPITTRLMDTSNNVKNKVYAAVNFRELNRTHNIGEILNALLKEKFNENI